MTLGTFACSTYRIGGVHEAYGQEWIVSITTQLDMRHAMAMIPEIEEVLKGNSAVEFPSA